MGMYFTGGHVQLTAATPVLRNTKVWSPGGSGVIGNGIAGAAIINCRIFYGSGQPGIQLSGCPGALIQNCELVCLDNVMPGQGADPNLNAIYLLSCDRAVINRVTTRDAATGAYVQSCSGVLIDRFKGIDCRGPFPRGQGVQFNACSNGALQNFWIVNDLTTCWTEDNVSVFQSTGMTVQNGFIDGNNSPSGDGVMFEGSTGTCTGVDVINWSNGAFGAADSTGVQFNGCRASRWYAPCSQGRGPPMSSGLVCSALGKSSGIVYNVGTFGPSPGGLVNDSSLCAVANVTALAADFIAPAQHAKQIAGASL